MNDKVLFEVASEFIELSSVNEIAKEVEPGLVQRFSKDSIGNILRRRYMQLLKNEQKLHEYEDLIKAIREKVGE